LDRMEVNRGSVVIVAHGEFGRPRPAVVVQADELGDATTTVLVCPITSDLTDKLPIRPAVEPKAENGLRLRSQIMTDKMVALPRDRVRQLIGTIDSETSDRLDTALLLVIGLAR
jgi:mRNA interferase MazF